MFLHSITDWADENEINYKDVIFRLRSLLSKTSLNKILLK